MNGLPVDENNYIMSYNDHISNDFIRSELTKRGIKVHPVYFGTHNGQGGSIRCATQPLKEGGGRQVTRLAGAGTGSLSLATPRTMPLIEVPDCSARNRRPFRP